MKKLIIGGFLLQTVFLVVIFNEVFFIKNEIIDLKKTNRNFIEIFKEEHKNITNLFENDKVLANSTDNNIKEIDKINNKFYICENLNSSVSIIENNINNLIKEFKLSYYNVLNYSESISKFKK